MKKNKKILILTKYSNLGASSRLRFLQYIPFLEKSGYICSVSPFFADSELKFFYENRRRRYVGILASYIRRMKALSQIKNYDMLLIEKETLPYFPGFFENIVVKSRIPYIIDYDDAIFHIYDASHNYLVKKVLSKKLFSLIRNAAVITAGNSYLADYMFMNGAKRVEKIPTVVDVNRYEYKPESSSEEFRIGWIGTPVTSKFLDVVTEAVESLAKKIDLRLVTVGAGDLSFDCPVESHPWSAETESELLSSINVGIMPLSDGPFQRGKCGYKLIQYMACGRAVIASPIGVNVDIVKNGVNGFLANDSTEWMNYLLFLAKNKQARAEMGLNNRKEVENNYSMQIQQQKLLKILNSVI